MTQAFTHTTLTAALNDYLEDASTEFVAHLDEIIGNGELRVLRDLDLKIFDTIDTGTLSVGVRTEAVPTGYLRAMSVYITVGTKQQIVLRRTYDWCVAYSPDAALQDAPKYYADLDETNLYFVPTPDAAYAYSIKHNKRPAGLDDSANPTTWLGTNVPDLLLYACLAESERFLTDPDRGKAWIEAYDNEKLPMALFELRDLTRAEYNPSRPTPTVGPDAAAA